MWLIWLEWNRRTFDDFEVSVLVMKGKFLAVQQFWDSGVSSLDASLLMDFLDSLAI